MRSATRPDHEADAPPEGASASGDVATHGRPKRFDEATFSPRPWLILGKGPSYSKMVAVDVDRFNILTINHVVERLPRCDIAHFADWEAFLDCADAAMAKARFVCMPYFPFVRFAPSTRSLAALAEESEPLRTLLRQGRVLSYNLVATSGRGTLPGFPNVELYHFSAEAVIDYLGKAGVSRIASLGVDGGNSYSTAFADLVGKTLLASGQPSYDYQFDGIVHALFRSGVDYAPLDIRSPIVVRITYPPSLWLAAAVLRYSLRRHCPFSIRTRLEPIRPSQLRATSFAHRGFVVHTGSRPRIELDPRSLVVGNLMPLMRRALGDSAFVPRVLSYRPSRPGPNDTHAPEPPWFRRFIANRIAMFERNADYPWRSHGAEGRHAWMQALREAVYWKQISIRQIRREIAIGHVSPTIFESMQRVDAPRQPVSRMAIANGSGKV